MSSLVFFTANDGVHGRELWVTDGTESGTRMVIDSVPGAGSGPAFAALGASGTDRVLFLSDGTIWSSDGTEAGTTPLRNIGVPQGTGLGFMAVQALGNDKVLFAGAGADGTGRGLWVSDGTAEGTQLLGPLTVFDTALLPDARLVMIADDGATGRELWVTDGTTSGTRQLADILSGAGDSMATNARLVLTGAGVVAARARDDVGGPDKLWVTDGAEVRPLVDAGFRSLPNFAQPDGTVLYQAFDSDKGTIFLSTDGTEAGTIDIPRRPYVANDAPEPVSYIGEPGSGVHPRFASSGGAQLGDGRVVYSAESERRELSDPSDSSSFIRIFNYGAQVWITDGTQEGTYLLPRVNDGAPRPEPGIPGQESPPWAPSSSPSDYYPLADGKVLFTAHTGDGRGLFITDGTQVERLAGGDEGDWFQIGDLQREVYNTLRDGTVLFVERDSKSLWVTDGTFGGTRQLAEDLTRIDNLVGFPNGMIMFAAEGDAGGLWMTDGTAQGTVRVIEDRAFWSPQPLSSSGLPTTGPWVFDATLPREPGMPLQTELWITDGTPGGTRFLSDQIVSAQFTDAAPLGDGRFVLRHVFNPEFGSDGNAEPAIFDLRDGSLSMLKDIYPGISASSPTGFTLVSNERPVPISDLFSEAFTTPDEPVALPLAPYFTAPDGRAITLSVSGLPAGVSFDPVQGVLSGAVTSQPDIYQVEVTATSAAGATLTVPFDFTVIDTGALRLASSTGWERIEPGGPITARPGATLLIGHKDGEAGLLRIEDGSASIDGGTLTVAGKVFAGQFATDLPLMEGGFAINLASLAVSDFEDTGAAASHRLVGDLIELAFSDIVIRPDGVTFRTDLNLDGILDALSTTGGLLALDIDADGPSFGLSGLGTGRWFSEDALALPLPEGVPFSLEFSDLGIDYDLLTDSAYFSGKAEFAWGEKVAKEYSFLADSTTSKLTLDLAGDQDDADSFFARGDKYLRIGRDGDGWNWDIIGEVKYEGQAGSTPAPGRPFIEEMRFEINTVDKDIEAGFKGTLPFLFKGLTLEAEIGAGWDPLAIDSFTFGIDGLNKPLGTTGIFVQGGKLAAENLTAQNPDDWPVVSAQITMSLGPTPLSPLRGHVGGEIEAAQVTLDIEANTQVGYLLPGEIERIAQPLIRWMDVTNDEVLEFELLKVAGSVAVDFARPTLSASLAANLLGDVITGTATFNSQMASDEVILVEASMAATATFPEAIPLIGGLSRSGNGLAVFSSDGDNSNDFAAAWTSFTVPLYGTVSAGLRFWLDGRYETLGSKAVDLIGSWALGPAQDLVILSAQWDNPTNSARLELIAPGGRVLTEAEFGTATGLAAGIALVEDLSSPTGRHVALLNPAAGVWDLRLVDETGLGAVRYEASEMLQGPQATITDVVIDAAARSGTIMLDLHMGDAADVALSLFVSDSPDVLSGLQVIDAVVPANAAGALSFDWDFAALASGRWWLHARTEAEGMVPNVDMFAAPVDVTGAADLSVTLHQRAAAGGASGASVLSVTVANGGDIASGVGVLELEVPDAVLNAPAVPGAAALVQTVTQVALPDLAPGESTRFDFALPSGLEAMVRPASATVSSPVYDADMGNNDAMLFLGPLQPGLSGTVTTRGGAVLAEAKVTAVLPDGSSQLAVADTDGGFTFSGLAPGAGTVDAAYAYTRGDPAITALDALDVLRMAVGLVPSFGVPGPMDFIAADINRDGTVTAFDALEVLRTAVGLASAHPPQWVFVDSTADLGGMTRHSVDYDTGIDLATHPLNTPLDMTAILLGNMIDPM